MTYQLNERVVIKYNTEEEDRIVNAIHDVLEKEGFREIDLILEVGKIEFTINEDLPASFSVQDFIEKLHHCDEDVSAVCSIDMDSNEGFYTVISSGDTPASVVYDIFSEFIGEVQRNLNYSLKNVTNNLFHSLEK